MARTVPTPNPDKYPSAEDQSGKANVGNTPRKCELPARPWSVPMPNAACGCATPGTWAVAVA